MTVELTLPWPPTVNTLHRNVRIGNRQATLLSEKGREYFDAAAYEVIRQRDGTRFNGRVACEITLHAPNRRRIDIDNRIKAVLDALTKGALWVDDSQVDVLVVTRGEVRRNGCAAVRVWELHDDA